jgi:hypothetical protein
MAITNTSAAFTSFASTSSNRTATYSQAYPSGTLIIIGYQNATKSSTAKLTAVQDNASPVNVYTEITVAGTSGRGTTSLWYCVLQSAVSASNVLTFTSTGTQASSYAGFALQSDGILTYSSNAKASSETFAAYQTILTSQGKSVSSGNGNGYLLSLFGFGKGNVTIDGVVYYGYSFPGKPASVRVATTANGTLSTAFANGQTIDGVVLQTGDRILIKNQSSGSQNGVYVVASSGAPTRASDFSSSSQIVLGTVSVLSGTTNGGKWFYATNTGTITVGTTSIGYAERTGVGSRLGFFYDGLTVGDSSVGLAYRAINTTGTLEGSKIAAEFNHSGYISITAHFTEESIIYSQHGVIEMF